MNSQSAPACPRPSGKRSTQLSARTWVGEEGAKRTLQFRVEAKHSTGIGIDLLWMMIYSVEVRGLPAGTYRVSLVRFDTSRGSERTPERVELQQTVEVP